MCIAYVVEVVEN
jgi:hypothetical protein